MGGSRTEPHSSSASGTQPLRAGGSMCTSHLYLPGGHRSQGWEQCPLQNFATIASLGSQSAVSFWERVVRGDLGREVVVGNETSGYLPIYPAFLKTAPCRRSQK